MSRDRQMTDNCSAHASAMQKILKNPTREGTAAVQSPAGEAQTSVATTLLASVAVILHTTRDNTDENHTKAAIDDTLNIPKSYGSLENLSTSRAHRPGASTFTRCGPNTRTTSERTSRQFNNLKSAV